MMYRINLIAFCLVVVVSQVSSQTQNPIDYSAYFKLVSDQHTFARFDLRYEGVKGTPFYSTEWLEGSFVTSNRELKIEDVELMINVMDQVLYMKQPSGQVFQIPMSHVEELHVEQEGVTKEFNVMPWSEIKVGDGIALCEVLFTHEKTDLIKSYAKTFVEANYKGAYAVGERYDQYVDKTDYYLKLNGQYEKVRINRASVTKLLPDEKDRIKKYLKDNKLDLNSESVLVSLISFLFQ